MSDPNDIDEEAAEEFNQFIMDFIDEYGHGRFFWMMRTNMDFIEREQRRTDPHNNEDDDGDSSDFRVDDDLF